LNELASRLISPTPTETTSSSPSFVEHQVATNASRLIRALPARSALRSPLLSILARDMKQSEAADFYGVSRSLISKATSSTNLASSILFQKNTFARRLKIPEYERQALVEFFHSNFTALSGSTRLLRRQMCTDDELYDLYLASLPSLVLSFEKQLLSCETRSARQRSNRAALIHNRLLSSKINNISFFLDFLATRLVSPFPILFNIISFLFGVAKPYRGVSPPTLLEIRSQANVRPLLNSYYGNWQCQVKSSNQAIASNSFCCSS
jgi:hypothetical protein